MRALGWASGWIVTGMLAARVAFAASIPTSEAPAPASAPANPLKTIGLGAGIT